MRYTIQTEMSKATPRGERYVYFCFTHYGERFKLSAGVTVKYPIDSCSLRRGEPSRDLKAARLRRVCAALDEYIARNPLVPYNRQKRDLRAIVRGGGEEAGGKTLADCVERFMLTKEKASTRGVYKDTLLRLREFDPNALPHDVDREWLLRFQRWLERRGHNPNGVGKHLRNIRAVVNFLIDGGEMREYPFRRFRIPCETGVPNALTAGELAFLRDYGVEPWQEIYRDLFMLSFYLCGANPSDMLLCRGLTGGRFVYRRMKTGRLYDIPVTEEAMAIVERYRGRDYLLSPMDGRADYHSFARRWNMALKKIGRVRVVPDRLGKMRKVEYEPLFPRLTVYSARYTFASLAAEIDIPRDTIALCLGHSWADVTERYILRPTRKIDEAVRRVADYVRDARPTPPRR